MFKQIEARSFGKYKSVSTIKLSVKARQLGISISEDVYQESSLTQRALLYIDEQNCMLMIAPSDCNNESVTDGSYKIQGKKGKFITARNSGFPDGYSAITEWELHKNGSILVTFPDPKNSKQKITAFSYPPGE